MATHNSINAPTTANTVVSGNGTGFTALGYSSTGGTSNLVSRDSNGNTFSNNFTSSSTSTVSSGSPVNLSPSTSRVQITTGTSTQTYKLPNATQLNLGTIYEFNNNSTGLVTINNNSNTLVTTVVSGGYKRVIVTDISSPAGVWDWHSLISANSSWGTLGAITSGYVNANSLNSGYTTTATAAGTTTLTSASTQQQFFTGSTTQTVVLPVTSTLALGQSFTIVNNSSGIVTVQSSGANTVQAMGANTILIVTVILTSGTSAASWNIEYSYQSPRGFTTVGNATTGNVCFDGTYGDTITGTAAEGLNFAIANNPSNDASVMNFYGGETSGTNKSGAGFSFYAGSGNGSGANGGLFYVVAGNAGTTGTGGGVQINAGVGGTSSGNGGTVIISGGSGVTLGGALQLQSGSSNNTPGVVTIIGGSSTGFNKNSNDMTLTSPIGSGTGTVGKIFLKSGISGTASSFTNIATVNRLIINGSVTTIVSGVAKTIATVTNASNSMAGGTVQYLIECSNGTDFQSCSGILSYALVNKAGTVTSVINVQGTEAQAISSGTITNTFSFSGASLQVTSTTSLSPTIFRITYTITNNCQQAVTVPA